jgi:hypothetical protein
MEVGHICLSPKRSNAVISNTVGAAAYYGSLDILKYCLPQLEKTYINVKC